MGDPDARRPWVEEVERSLTISSEDDDDGKVRQLPGPLARVAPKQWCQKRGLFALIYIEEKIANFLGLWAIGRHLDPQLIGAPYVTLRI